MDDLERRIAVLELLAIEDLALRPPGHLDQMADSIRAGLVEAIDDDERAVRLGALQMIDDGRRRFDVFS